MIHINNHSGGRWAVLVNGGVLLRCRTKTEAKRLVRDGQHPTNPYKCKVRRWKRAAIDRTRSSKP